MNEVQDLVTPLAAWSVNAVRRQLSVFYSRPLRDLFLINTAMYIRYLVTKRLALRLSSELITLYQSTMNKIGFGFSLHYKCIHDFFKPGSQ